MHYTEDEIVGTATHHGQDYSFEFALVLYLDFRILCYSVPEVRLPTRC